jgi:ABC-type enterobactin transport system permease subunit
MSILVFSTTTVWCVAFLAVLGGIVAGLIVWATSGSKKINIKNSSTPPSLH